MGAVKFKIYEEWVFRKLYTVIEQDGVKKHYRPKNVHDRIGLQYGKLELSVDPVTGLVVPTNAKQETKQILSKKLAKELKEWRKDFREFAETYWDLTQGPSDNVHGHGIHYDRIPHELISMKQINRVELLKWIKLNSFEWTWGRGTGTPNHRIQKVWGREAALKRQLPRFTRAIYHSHAKEHTYENVPLGTPCARHKYSEDKWR